jgi:hypothetical protein
MNHSGFVKVAQILAVLMVGLLALGHAGCHAGPTARHSSAPVAAPTSLEAISLDDAATIIDPSQVQLHSARNEWTSFSLQVTGVSVSRPVSLRLSGFASGSGGTAGKVGPGNFRAYQILPMPVKVNPGYVRSTGINAGNQSLPRALLPLMAVNGRIGLSALRDATQPTNPLAHPNGGTVLLWVDLHVPLDAEAGDYAASFSLIDSRGRKIGRDVNARLKVYDFALPNEPHLQIIGDAHWKRLAALFPQQLGDAIAPNLVNRGNPRYAQSVQMLDRLMLLADEHRAQLVIPGLGPTVKWPTGQPPQIDWEDFDSVIGPWMRGTMFPDHVPLEFWPVPAADDLDRFDAASRTTYWSRAAQHFDQLNWLPRSAITLGLADDQAGNAAESMAREAARILAACPRVRVALPLDQSQLAAEQGSMSPNDQTRLVTAAPPLVSSADPAFTGQQSPENLWLWPTPAGPANFSGQESDIEAWAWLAFLRHVPLVLWDSALPAADSPSDPADPGALTWFYPGQWFGVSEPVPTVQLKWLRRAEQDFEYLWLAQQRGEATTAQQMARLMTKPVEVQPGKSPDPAYSLLTGVTTPAAWAQARELLAGSILLHSPGQALDQTRQRALAIGRMQWAQPLERPLVMPKAVHWSLEGPRPDRFGIKGGNWLGLRLDLDIYTPSAATPEKNLLRWTPVSPGGAWSLPKQPVELAPLPMLRLQSASMAASMDLSRFNGPGGTPLGINFVNGFTRVAYPIYVRLPVAVSEHREAPLSLDGKLSDWSSADALQDGPLVLMMNRPDVQKQQLHFAPVNARLYSMWSDDNLYLAFSLEGLSPLQRQTHNDVYYQARRAYGEDLCEVLIQPVYADKTPGPLLHMVCKPGGADWVELRQPAAPGASTWEASEGAGVRYATTAGDDRRWHGELAIPWKLINSAGKAPPVLLRFNFSQHRHAACESASWCGPVDFGRDEKMMGAIYLKKSGEVIER